MEGLCVHHSDKLSSNNSSSYAQYNSLLSAAQGGKMYKRQRREEREKEIDLIYSVATKISQHEEGGWGSIETKFQSERRVKFW